MSVETPTTEEVRDTYEWGATTCGCCADSSPRAREEFDRWLAVHDADVLLTEARSGLYGTFAQSRLIDRALRLRERARR